MSRVLYPFNFVPNGQIFDGDISYSPCFRKRLATDLVGTRTGRPIGLTLTDAMRLAWIVRSFKIDFINIQQQEIYMYQYPQFMGPPDFIPTDIAPPNDESQLVCCGFSSPSDYSFNPIVWGPTVLEAPSPPFNFFLGFGINSPREWIADGYPTPQNPNPNFNPINDLTIYPIIVVQISSRGPSPGTNYVAFTTSVSNSPKVSGVFLPKSAGFSKDYELDYYKGTSSSTFNAIPTFTFDNFWEYRDENGENPIWNKITGARM